MAIKDNVQPEIINIDNELRLIKPDKTMWSLAEVWYQNPKVMYYSEGKPESKYNKDDIDRMYGYLSDIGELYFIEVKMKDEWRTIGDVTLAESNMPIMIGDENYWGLGIGKKVLKCLIARAKVIGLKSILVPEIYHYNARSRNLFKSLGLKKVSENEKAESYILYLN